MRPITETIAALAATRTIDFTTTGRRTGQPRTVEIWWFRVDGRFFITGTPGRRDWYANVLSDPEVEISTPIGSFAASAVPVTDVDSRRAVFTDPAANWYSNQSELDRLIETAPMVEIHLKLSR
jgi:deazaflavin-dependent oxidoreductase (nitroreductase family)